jgi:hypothetical protein
MPTEEMTSTMLTEEEPISDDEMDRLKELSQAIYDAAIEDPEPEFSISACASVMATLISPDNRERREIFRRLMAVAHEFCEDDDIPDLGGAPTTGTTRVRLTTRS